MKTISYMPKGFKIKSVVGGKINYNWSGENGKATLKYNSIVKRPFFVTGSIKIYLPENIVPAYHCSEIV